jgi:hypothetical protein
MKLQPGEAAVLIIRRSETEPTKYWFAVRKSGSSFDHTTHDFQLGGLQEAVSELGENLPFADALEKAIAAIRKVEP